ncbi:unnamed protein product [Effrenium voratum]|nr:unnamed protein product [Effrenium voratum]
MGYLGKVEPGPTSPVAKLFQAVEPLIFLKERVARSPSASEATPDASFVDFADLEKGGGSAVHAAKFRQPAMPSEKLHRYTIVASASSDFHLMTEGLELVMIARTQGTKQVDFFLPDEEQAIPAFSMRRQEADEWVLVQPRCDCCAHRPHHRTCDFLGRSQQVACIQHSRRKVDKCSVHFVDMFVPPLLTEDQSSLWCPAWMGKDLGCKTPLSSGSLSPKSTRSPSFHLMAPEGADAIHLQSKLPVWNSDLEGLILNFEGRSMLRSSPRNFVVQEEEGKIVMQHAQIAENTWCLDFNHPLSVVQAFAMAMASIDWE